MLGMLTRPLGRFVSDPRHYQIAILAALLSYGIFGLGLPVKPLHSALIVITCFATQWFCTRIYNVPKFEWHGALLSALALCLLLRTDIVWVAVFAAFIAIASKFTLRSGGKYIFNPANLGIVLMVGLDVAWVSSEQWDSPVWLSFLAACLGMMALTRAATLDSALGFLAFYSAIHFGWALWLGAPFSLPLYQLENGALLIFAFFMISDPKTTPDSRQGRLLFAALVAGLGAYLKFGLSIPHGLFYALAFLAPAVPLIDRARPGRRYACA